MLYQQPSPKRRPYRYETRETQKADTSLRLSGFAFI